MISLGITSTFYNEELLLPYFIRHYLPIVDECIMINHHSTDRSVEIIREMAPHWRIVNTSSVYFDAAELDEEAKYYEEQLYTRFKCSFNTTELIFHKDIKGLLEDKKDHLDALGFKAYMMVDLTEKPLGDNLFKGRTEGYLDDETAWASRRWRYIHQQEYGHYTLGRHYLEAERVELNHAWNLYFLHYSPWPQSLPRKAQILARRSPDDIRNGAGLQHGTPEQIKQVYEWEKQKAVNLLEVDSNFKMHYDYFSRL